jgi:hypothetical protein
MSSVTETVNAELKLYQEASKKRLKRYPLGTATYNKILNYYGQRMRVEDWGRPGPSSQQELSMVRGVIKLLKKEFEDKEIFQFMYDCVHHWKQLRDMESVTLKGKSWILDPRPNLRDIFVCHKAHFANLLEIRRTTRQKSSGLVTPDIQRGSLDIPKQELIRRRGRTQWRPSQTDIDNEYEGLEDE